MPNVLITGANRGIGLQLTKHYIEAGWEVIATYRNAEGNEALQALASPQLTLLQADVNNDEGISKIASYFQGQGLDLLINNAGIYGPRDQTFGKVERQAWREILEVNTISPMMLAQSLADSLAQNKGTKGKNFNFKLPSTHNTFVYLISGEIEIGKNKHENVKDSTLILLTKGENLTVKAKSNAKFLVISGKPINEEIARGGPFVMNTKAEILQAVQDYHNGTFVK